MRELKYITDDTSRLVTTTGLGTGKDVYLNGSPEKFLLLRLPDKDEWARLRAEFLWMTASRRIEWLGTAKSGGKTLRAFSLQNLRDFLRFDYLKHRWFCKVVSEFPSDSEDGACHRNYLSQLTLGEQKELWERIKPRTYESALTATQSHMLRKHDGLNLEAVFDTDDVLQRINLLISMLGYSSISGRYKSLPGSELITGVEFKTTIHTILAFLWQRKIILYALRFKDHILERTAAERGAEVRPGYLLKVTLNPLLFEPDIVRIATAHRPDAGRDARTRETSVGSYIPWMILSTTVRDIGDISPSLLEATSALGLKTYKWWHDLRRAYESCYGPASFPQPALANKRDALRTRSFVWVLERDQSLKEWTELFEETFANGYKTYKPSEYVNARFFFRWMLSWEGNRPTPETLSKFDIRDERKIPGTRTSFRKFLDESRSETTATQGEPIRSTTKMLAVNQLRNVMEHHRQKNLAMIQANRDLIGRVRVDNPVSPQDSLWKAHVPRRTHRTAIGADVIHLCKGILLDPSEDGKPSFQWAMQSRTFRLDWVIIEKVHTGRWPFERPYDDKFIQVWQPTRALALYTMLEIPLRSFQVRWLDSGAGDEYVWDLEAGKLVPNDDEMAEPGRQEGVFQPVSDRLAEGDSGIGLYVTTNKTQLWNPEVNQGFIIPWPNESFYEALNIQRQWCAFISTVVHTQPVRLSDDDFNVHDKVKDLLPSYHVLFRDASRLTSLTRPISRSKIDSAWGALCKEAQERLKESGVHLRLVKEKNDKSGETRAIHDLHSLRVSGITNLFLKGVPVEIISRYIAGHASIAMTLHYESSDPVEIRRRLHRWVLDAKPAGSDDRVEALFHLLDSEQPVSPSTLKDVFGEDALERLFVTNEFAGGSGAAYAAIAEGSGSWAWYGDGICPGTRCAEGDESGGPVKGGPRSCGNCRYFMTGVAFIYGQAHKCNQLMYELRSLGVERERCLREKRAKIDYGPAQRDLQLRIDELDSLIEPKLSDWWGRYKLLQKSMQAASREPEHEGSADAGREGALVAMSQAGVAVSAERTNQFHLLKELCLSAEILGLASDAGAPVLEIRAMINVLLSKHGVEPFLIGVPDDGGRRLTNVVAQALENLFRAHYSCSAASAFERMEHIARDTDSVTDPILASSIRQLADALKALGDGDDLSPGLLTLSPPEMKQIGN